MFSKKIIFGLIILFTISIISCEKKKKQSSTNTTDSTVQKDTSSTETVSLPEYTILKDEVYDAPIKTQVNLDVLVKGDINENNLRGLLNKLYSSAMSRRNFEFHNPPTNIYIYVYTSKEKAQANAGLWIAMLQKHYGAKPKITIETKLLSQTNKESEEKFGFTEDERKKIFKKLCNDDTRAMKEAEKKYPDDIDKQMDLSEELYKKYRKELCEKYGLTKEQFYAIQSEGVAKKWVY